MDRKETIAAIATGLTDSGIGIIRISGENALEIGDVLFRSPSGRRVLRNAISYKMYYGYVLPKNISLETEKNWKQFVIDEVMAIVMKAPKSFTGEDTVEIQCHGGVYVMQKILSQVLAAGARLAEPGEFTKRAFLNGKMDLTRAEAVMDVIRSQNEFALEASVSHLTGALFKKIKGFRDDILYEIAFIESALDDPEHISLEGYVLKLEKKLEYLLREVKELIATAESGRLIQEGIRTVIVGKPNVGKSSLMNLLIGEDRAIVTNVAGTTRDALQESVRLDGIVFHITDTAGIHRTEDVVEKIGVERARKYAEDADFILYVLDGSVPLDERDREILPVLKNKKFVVLFNKSDLEAAWTEEDLKEMFRGFLPEEETFPIIRTSASEGEGIKELKEAAVNLFFQGEIQANHQLTITNFRHKEALEEAVKSLELVKKSVENRMPEDFYSIDLMNAYASLGRIIGEEVDDDLIEEIFSKFCVGK